MSETRTLCIAQVGYEGPDVHEHVERLKTIIDEHCGADLLVFPELILHGHPTVDEPEGFLYRRSLALYGAISRDVHRFVRDRGARVIFGEIRRRAERLFNVAVYADANGVQAYTKTHVHWSENFVPGRSLRIFKTAIGGVGITICFDAAFQEVWRVLALRGADLIVNISAVPREFPVRFMHRRLQGAAINNQIHVAYVNRPEPKFAGGSAIFDPRGDIVAAAGTETEIFQAEIDLGDRDAWREEEMIFPNRRPNLYQAINNSAHPSRLRRSVRRVAS
jgi:predicted amidohydrolase